MASKLLKKAAAEKKSGKGLEKAADRGDPADVSIGFVPLPRGAQEGTAEERLAALEKVIGKAQDTAELTVRQSKERFVREAAPALAYIHDHPELWEAGGYTNFVDYVQRRWGYSSTHGYLLVATVGVQQALPEGARANSGHVQVLSTVLRSHGADAVRDVWAKAEKPGGQPTAAALKTSVDALGYSSKPKTISGKSINRDDGPGKSNPIGQLENAVAMMKRQVPRGLVKKAMDEDPDKARTLAAELTEWAEYVTRPATK